MTFQTEVRTTSTPVLVSTPVQNGLLQRKCHRCGSQDDERKEERNKQLNLQRRSIAGTGQTAIPTVVHEVLSSPGEPLDRETRAFMEPRFGHDFSRVRVHADDKAAYSAKAVNALAYTVGRDIVFNAGYYVPKTNEGLKLLAHELVHTVQQQNETAGKEFRLIENTYLERDASHNAEKIISGETTIIAPGVSELGVMRSVAEKILTFSIKWLSKRTVNTVSKHIAKHGRRIAGKAIHSVFKSPKNIKSMLETTVKEAAELAGKHPKAPVTQALEESGLKIARQSTGTPGKFRWVVQKTFNKEIGTKGEKILRIIIDQSGRIVTAFPADRLIAIGLGVAAIEVIGERTAEANTAVRQMAKEEAAQREKEEGLQWEDFIPFIGAIYGGSLNVGEYEELREWRFIQQVIDDVIKEVESSESRSLSQNERMEIAELVRSAIAAPLLAEEEVAEE